MQVPDLTIREKMRILILSAYFKLNMPAEHFYAVLLLVDRALKKINQDSILKGELELMQSESEMFYW